MSVLSLFAGNLSRLVSLLGLSLAVMFTGIVRADEQAQVLVDEIIAAAGGREALPRLFRIKELLNVSSDAEKKGNERLSVIELPEHWWLGKQKRADEPAQYLVWAWSLQILLAQESKLERLASIREGDVELVGLRISGSVKPEMDLYVASDDKRLMRIDWRTDIHRFSHWKTVDGFRYPTRCVGTKKATSKPWYFTEILSLEKLAELPEGLQRK